MAHQDFSKLKIGDVVLIRSLHQEPRITFVKEISAKFFKTTKGVKWSKKDGDMLPRTNGWDTPTAYIPTSIEIQETIISRKRQEIYNYVHAAFPAGFVGSLSTATTLLNMTQDYIQALELLEKIKQNTHSI